MSGYRKPRTSLHRWPDGNCATWPGVAQISKYNHKNHFEIAPMIDKVLSGVLLKRLKKL